MSTGLSSDLGSSRSRHPPLQAGWLEAPHHRIDFGDFPLENGTVIRDFSLSFAVHGDLADTRLPVTLVTCAIGSTHHRLDFLIGAGRPLDPQRTRILAVDAIGNGLTTSPSTSISQPGFRFPRFSVRDMVRSQKLLLDRLEVGIADLVIGASMGGMQALQWGVSWPHAVRRIVALTPMAKTAPWASAINHAARHSLLARLPAEGGNLDYPDDIWDGWTAIMQLIAMRTPQQVDEEFSGSDDVLAWLAERACWWSGQRFHPIDWVYQSWAYDTHDVGTSVGFDGDTARALNSIRVPTLIAAASLDLYNPTESASWAAAHIPDCEFLRIDSNWGHLMASAADVPGGKRLGEAITRFLARTAPQRVAD